MDAFSWLGTSINHLQLAKGILENRLLRHRLEVSDRLGCLVSQLLVKEKGEGKVQSTEDHDVSKSELLTNQVLLAARESSLHAADTGLELGDVHVVDALGVGDVLVDNDAADKVHGHGDVGLAKGNPLVDLGPGAGVGAVELVGGGAALGDEAADGDVLGEAEAVRGLEGRDLALGELGEELGLLVGHAHLEALGVGDLEAIELGSDLGLGHC